MICVWKMRDCIRIVESTLSEQRIRAIDEVLRRRERGRILLSAEQPTLWGVSPEPLEEVLMPGVFVLYRQETAGKYRIIPDPEMLHACGEDLMLLLMAQLHWRAGDVVTAAIRDACASLWPDRDWPAVRAA